MRIILTATATTVYVLKTSFVHQLLWISGERICYFFTFNHWLAG